MEDLRKLIAGFEIVLQRDAIVEEQRQARWKWVEGFGEV